MPPKGYKLSDEQKKRISIANTKGKVKCICKACGKEFEIFPSQLRRGEGVYCSRKCCGADRIGKPIPKETCRKRSESLKGRVMGEVWRKKLSEAAKRVQSDPKRKAQQAELASKRFKGKPGVWTGKNLSEEHKRKLSIKMSQRRLSKTHKENISCALKGMQKSEEMRMKEIETKLGGFWYGKVRYNGVKYCELWEDVNPRVHAFFDYKCCNCGIKENGRSHIGHHVFYVKEACCWESEDGLYYTNLNAPNHPESDYFIGENPNYFVILCKKCHGKTNGNFENRKKWADHFKELIDTKYGGKCYLTKEEYGAHTSGKV